MMSITKNVASQQFERRGLRGLASSLAILSDFNPLADFSDFSANEIIIESPAHQVIKEFLGFLGRFGSAFGPEPLVDRPLDQCLFALLIVGFIEGVFDCL